MCRFLQLANQRFWESLFDFWTLGRINVLNAARRQIDHTILCPVKSSSPLFLLSPSALLNGDSFFLRPQYLVSTRPFLLPLPSPATRLFAVMTQNVFSSPSYRS